MSVAHAAGPGRAIWASCASIGRRCWRPAPGWWPARYYSFLNNIFSPHLIAEFGWSRSDFALIGMTTVISVICLPIAGRLTDRYGMRRIAVIGVIGLPLAFFGLAAQTGGFGLFFLLSTLQMLMMSALTGIGIYGRLIVRYFHRARGLALGVASCSPALVVALVSPLLSAFVEAYGWRAGYVAMGVGVATLGAAALLMVPRSFRDVDTRPREERSLRADYGELLRTRAFLVIFGAMVLCNLQYTAQTTQLSMIVQEKGVSVAAGAAMISIFAGGVIVGRIACGAALDRFEPRLVAFVCFLFPALGLAVLASGADGALLVGLGVLSLGFSVGAEGDVAAYLATRYFRPELFSSVVGLFTSAIAISALIGAFVISTILAATGGYALFLAIAWAAVASGAALFLLLGKSAAATPDEEPDGWPWPRMRAEEWTPSAQVVCRAGIGPAVIQDTADGLRRHGARAARPAGHGRAGDLPDLPPRSRRTPLRGY